LPASSITDWQQPSSSAELGEHPAITAAPMGHRDPRMTLLRVYTDVTGMKPRTRLGGLLDDGDWASSRD